MEHKIEKLICEILGISEFGEQDDFFLKGGGSLEAIKLRNCIRTELGCDISLAEIFRHADLSSIASACRPLEVQQPEEGTIPVRAGELSLEQEGIWMYEKMYPSDYFRLTAIQEVQGEIDVERLQLAIKQTVQNHEMLRAEVRLGKDGLPMIQIQESFSRTLEILNWSKMPFVSDKSVHDAVKMIALSLDMEKIEKTARFVLIKLPQHRSFLTIGIHHLYSDEASFQVIFREIWDRYQNRTVRDADRYTTYIMEERRTGKLQVRSEKRERLERLAEQLYLEIPCSGTVKPGEFSTFVKDVRISDTYLQDLQLMARSRNLTMHTLFLGAFQILLHQLTGADLISVGIPVNSRMDDRFSDTCGLFVRETLIIQEISEADSFITFCGKLQLTVVDQIMDASVPFERLIRDLKHEKLLRTLPNHLHFNYIEETCRKDTKNGSPHISAIRFAETGHLCDLGLIVERQESRCRIALVANKNYLSESLLEGYADQFMTLLQTIVEGGMDRPISELCHVHSSDEDEIEADFSF
ncbi:condensation domain-containing protein [Ruminococcus albus]|uniref:Condensation domain protein n=1 Tax=Ruminococcus albus (strain ATCC 27210 / DSM 20455 / JCM 14654 / NCDO 2250 / 7) TaxID=697329 RepID=E6UAS7_RUMA7|nr:condensation domain-containing protein [Ruminococcus albus]ADU21406.1 condensation domain protein [Ruminococcus albus 7 = DSM 20455]